MIFYHFQLPWFSGGYVGVDIFFVISGYLITGIIYKEAQEGRFSLLKFYDRRVRRIIPALTAVVLCTFLAGLFVLLPEDLDRLGESTISVAVFGSNLYFWQIAGYFTPEAHEMPLLHTWSLAVEEQFYILWPVVLSGLMFFKSRRLLVAAFGAAFICSIALNEWLIQRDSISAAFYLAPARAWELLLGAALVLNGSGSFGNRTQRNLLSTIGLALIAYAVFVFDKDTPFPGVYALLPCAGTALLILTGKDQGSFVSKFLSTRLLVFIGLISYSLYLWHWPLISYFTYLNFRAPTPGETIVMVAACFALSILSWKFVELPFRKKRHKGIESSQVVWRGAVAVLVTLLVGTSAVASSGFPKRLNDEALAVVNQPSALHPTARECLAGPRANEPLPGCLLGDHSDTRKYQVVLWGDSHAAHFMPTIEKLAEEGGWIARQMTMAGCAPLLGGSARSERYRLCPEFNRNVVEELASNEHIRLVVLAARWMSHEPRIVELPDTLARLEQLGKFSIVMGQIPEADFAPNRCLALAHWYDRQTGDCDIDKFGSRMSRVSDQTKYLLELQEHYEHLDVFNPLDHLCDDRRCFTQFGDRSLYFDNNHLNPDGAVHIARYLAGTALASSVENLDRLESVGMLGRLQGSGQEPAFGSSGRVDPGSK